ncbi:MAG TPA: hypothetical protein VIY48_00770 [Candidatus Paceibacterota bacterium]
MDIEDRAAKWADSHIETSDHPADCLHDARQDLIAAYLAGSAQTQADYAASGYGS